MRKRLDWSANSPPKEPPRHPYRDTALVYLGFAVLIVVVATVTGGSFLRAILFAALFWVVATAYGVVSWRRKQRGQKLP